MLVCIPSYLVGTIGNFGTSSVVGVFLHGVLITYERGTIYHGRYTLVTTRFGVFYVGPYLGDERDLVCCTQVGGGTFTHVTGTCTLDFYIGGGIHHRFSVDTFIGVGVTVPQAHFGGERHKVTRGTSSGPFTTTQGRTVCVTIRHRRLVYQFAKGVHCGLGAIFVGTTVLSNNTRGKDGHRV